jgi:hypothetical protein
LIPSDRVHVSLVRRRLTRAAVAGVAWLAPAYLMFSHQVAAVRRAPLTQQFGAEPLRDIEIPRVEYLTIPGLLTVHRVRLQTKGATILTHDAIELLFSTYDTAPHLQSGEILFQGSDCNYRTAAGASLRNNSFLAFTRTAPCVGLASAPSGEITLTLRFSNKARVALWGARAADSERLGSSWRITDRTVAATRDLAIVGRTVDWYPAHESRASLIAYMWQLPWSGSWVWYLVALSAVCVSLSALLWPDTRQPQPCRRINLRLALCALLIAGALGLMHTVATPPFQAADEPHHFTGFAWRAGRRDVDVETARWARVAHFRRIQFHSDQHFTPFDRLQLGEPWFGGAPPYAERGVGIEWLWRMLVPLFRSFSAEQMLLALRLTNVVLFAITAAAALSIVAACTQTKWPELSVIPMFLVPTLPFFATTVSNYAPLTCTYLLFGIAVLLHFRGESRSAVAGPLLGASWGIAALLSRSAIPLAPLVGTMAAGRLLTHRGHRFPESCVYWLGLTATIAAAMTLAGSNYVGPLETHIRAALGNTTGRAVSLIVTHPFLILLVSFVTVPLDVRNRSSLGRPARDATALFVRRAALATALSVAICIIASAFVRLPTVPPVGSMPTAKAYVARLLLAVATMARIRHADFATSTSFWGGFGWLDTFPPEWFISLLAIASGAALISFLLEIRRSQSVQMATSFLALVTGAAASVVLYAVGVLRVTPADVVGRYLFGLQFSGLMVMWSSVGSRGETQNVAKAGRWVALCAAGCACAQLFSLSVILQRYF